MQTVDFRVIFHIVEIFLDDAALYKSRRELSAIGDATIT